MKRYFLVFILTAVLMNAYAQSYKKSKFLYGKAKSKEPLSICFSAGILSSKTFYNADYIKMENSIAINLGIEKPINYRLAYGFDLRLLGSLTGSELNLPLSEQNSISQQSSYAIKNSFDISTSLKFLVFEMPYASLSIASGLGLINRATEIKTTLIDTTTTSQVNAFMPFCISSKIPFNKNIDLTVGYRYYLTFTDNLDAAVIKKNNDKYGFLYFGINYNLGIKGSRYKKKNTCPGLN